MCSKPLLSLVIGLALSFSLYANEEEPTAVVVDEKSSTEVEATQASAEESVVVTPQYRHQKRPQRRDWLQQRHQQQKQWRETQRFWRNPKAESRRQWTKSRRDARGQWLESYREHTRAYRPHRRYGHPMRGNLPQQPAVSAE